MLGDIYPTNTKRKIKRKIISRLDNIVSSMNNADKISSQKILNYICLLQNLLPSDNNLSHQK